MSKNFKIGLLDHLGGGNLGDDATLQAMIQNIKRRLPDAEMLGFSMNPSDTQTRHGIPAYPIRREKWDTSWGRATEGPRIGPRIKGALGRNRLLLRGLRIINSVIVRAPGSLFGELLFLLRSLRVLFSLDLLIISGGGQLLDSWGGPWKYPYTIFKWVALARLSGTRCYVINVGAGPLTHRLSNYFIRTALHLSSYTSFRDQHSLALSRSAGFMRSSTVYPDTVYGLDVSADTISRALRRQAGPIVGISPMAYCDPRRYWHKDVETYRQFICKLSLFAAQIVRDQYFVEIFSTDIEFDTDAMGDLMQALTENQEGICAGHVAHVATPGIEALLSEISTMDYVVTCRFHGVVFAHLMNKPVLALAHHQKVTSLMADLGLAEFCLDIRNLDPESLLSAFTRMVEREGEIRDLMSQTVKRNRILLEEQFDELFKGTTSLWSAQQQGRSWTESVFSRRGPGRSCNG